MKGLIVLANGFEDLEAIGTIAILRRGGLDLDICTIEDTNPTGKYGVTVDAVLPFSAIKKEDYEVLILPGGPGFARLKENKELEAIILSFYEEKKYIAAICAAPTILGHLGLLKDRQYTCFPGMQEDGFLGNYSEKKVVTDGFIITGKAAGGVTEFALAILSALKGPAVSQAVKAEIYY